jgi:hypothetical protein
MLMHWDRVDYICTYIIIYNKFVKMYLVQCGRVLLGIHHRRERRDRVLHSPASDMQVSVCHWHHSIRSRQDIHPSRCAVVGRGSIKGLKMAFKKEEGRKG